LWNDNCCWIGENVERGETERDCIRMFASRVALTYIFRADLLLNMDDRTATVRGDSSWKDSKGFPMILVSIK
jgi:hypothetical protein